MIASRSAFGSPSNNVGLDPRVESAPIRPYHAELAGLPFLSPKRTDHQIRKRVLVLWHDQLPEWLLDEARSWVPNICAALRLQSAIML